MNIYYRREITWQKWPDNDCVDTDIVYFSTSKKKFKESVFHECDPQTKVTDRVQQVALKLRVKASKINLIKI